MSRQPKYRFYATLLDTFQSYLSSGEIWQKYWGDSSKEDAPTAEEFEARCFHDLIDRINRVPFSSEKADRGTCFNEIVDCLILNRNTDRSDMTISADRETQTITAILRDKAYTFPMCICREFAKYYQGATPQVLCSGVLTTKYGDVELYGYIDELMPFGIHDIKTTGSYSAGDFRNHWQHHVYPYCMEQMGNHIEHFEYNICEIKSSKSGCKYTTFTEYYPYIPDVSIPALTGHCEGLIEFIEIYRDLITDKKIFNEL